MSRAWIDISRPLVSGMAVWPGDPAVRVERVSTIASGGPFNLSAISMCLHTGTHVDAPLHFLEGGPSVAEMPLEALVGPARVIGIRDPKAIRARELEPLRLRRGERVLFKTRGAARRWQAPEFCTDYVYVAADAAGLLVERGVRAVGIDYLSIGAPSEEGYEVHRTLLGAGIWIVEGLDLSAASPGRYELICLPLKVPGADGAPARAILRPGRKPL
ncbi:MAG TPA: cyclase family protein [Bryobacteraceae bacterium]|nr:cyclase family protein [Bryobacteraceae bacterium]